MGERDRPKLQGRIVCRSATADSKCEAIFCFLRPLPSLLFPPGPADSLPYSTDLQVSPWRDDSPVTLSAGREGPPKPGTRHPFLRREGAETGSKGIHVSMAALQPPGHALRPPKACLSKSRGNPRSCGCRPRKGRRSGSLPPPPRPRCPPVASERPKPK